MGFLFRRQIPHVTPSKQRYETMKKCRERFQRGVDLIAGLGEALKKESTCMHPFLIVPHPAIHSIRFVFGLKLWVKHNDAPGVS